MRSTSPATSPRSAFGRTGRAGRWRHRPTAATPRATCGLQQGHPGTGAARDHKTLRPAHPTRGEEGEARQHRQRHRVPLRRHRQPRPRPPAPAAGARSRSRAPRRRAPTAPPQEGDHEHVEHGDAALHEQQESGRDQQPAGERGEARRARTTARAWRANSPSVPNSADMIRQPNGLSPNSVMPSAISSLPSSGCSLLTAAISASKPRARGQVMHLVEVRLPPGCQGG